jgi:hypothetical protein
MRAAIFKYSAPLITNMNYFHTDSRSTEMNGQFLGREFNPLDYVPVTAFTLPPLIKTVILAKAGIHISMH